MTSLSWKGMDSVEQYVVDAAGTLPGLLLQQLRHELASGGVIDFLQPFLLERIRP